MLHKKLQTQNSSRASVLKNRIEDKRTIRKRNDDDEEPEERSDEGSKWVKTDSECKFILTFIFTPSHNPSYNPWTNKFFFSCRYCSRNIILLQCSISFN